MKEKVVGKMNLSHAGSVTFNIKDKLYFPTETKNRRQGEDTHTPPSKDKSGKIARIKKSKIRILSQAQGGLTTYHVRKYALMSRKSAPIFDTAFLLGQYNIFTYSVFGEKAVDR